MTWTCRVCEPIHPAKAHGKHVHMGRVNSERRFKYAASIGCDSCDGTFLTYGPDVNLPRLMAWLRTNDYGTLDFGGSLASAEVRAELDN
jgi:hypothetical protein